MIVIVYGGAGISCADDATAQAEGLQTVDGTKPANRLAKESSPYLLLHAHNPIDWYPWGPEAFAKAKAEDKPVFLSIGYSSCYWCHVMERQTFSNATVAEFLNQHFVCIKVDREERPDIDDIYMTSLIVYQQAAGSSGGGGWPLSMFLTPEGDPIAGATYLPPEDTEDGRTGFLTASGRIHDLWRENREAIHATSSMLAREVRRLSGPGVLADPVELDRTLLTTAAADIRDRYDPIHGGVDLNRRSPGGPRFPNTPRLMLLLRLAEETPDPSLSDMVHHSLRAMALGGIRDHLGGGFHRYSTDRKWIVPHFEKMLYDQAQLLEVYAVAARSHNDPLYLQVIGELVEFLRREMTLPDGGFCSALDAETNAVEGEYYAWTEQEIRSLLSPDDAELFLVAYGFQEPQSFEHGRVLYLPRPVSDLATQQNIEPAALESRLENSRRRLLVTRNQRERPLLDDKVLTEWNALMIQALAISGRLPGREADLELASNAAHFLLTNLRDDHGNLLRSWRNGTQGQRAYLDDYASLVSALRALHDATSNTQWLDAAIELTDRQVSLFHDPNQRIFHFTSHDQEQLFARSGSPYDSVSPSGNSVTVRNLLALAEHKTGSEYRQIAASTLERFSGTMKSSPSSCSGMLMALLDLLTTSPAPEDTVRVQAFRPVLPEPVAASPDSNQEERPVKAKIYPYFDKLPRGGKCPVAIELMIDGDWHINANPASPDFLVPTEVKMTSSQKVRMTKVRYPKHELLTVEGQDEPSHVYGGKITIYVLLETDAAEKADKAEMDIEIRFQACNEKTCLPPDTIRLRGKLPVADPGDEIKRINESRFPKDDENDDKAKSDDKPR